MRVVDARAGARTDWGVRSLPGVGLVIDFMASGSCDASLQQVVSFNRNNICSAIAYR